MVAKTSLTAKAFERLAESLGPCELERGEVLPLSPGGIWHSGVSVNIAALLWNWARKTGRGRVFSNEAGLITQTHPDTVRGVDVAYFSYKRLPKGQQPQGFSKVPPELAVEVIGKGQGWKKMVEKAGEYLAMGVDRVWVVDPKTRRVHVFQPDQAPAVYSERQAISDPAVLPGFRCPVRRFFED